MLRGILKVLAFSSFLAVWSCNTMQPVAGTESGSQTTNGRVEGVIENSQGTPAPKVQVKLIDARYDPVKNGLIPLSMTDTTDEAGCYHFGKVDTGSYNIESQDPSAKTSHLRIGVVVKNDTIRLAPDTVRIPGTVKVFLPDSADTQNAYVYIPGSTVYAFVNSSSAPVILDSVPSGVIPSISYAVRNNAAASRKVADTTTLAPGDTVTCYAAWTLSKKLYFNTTSTGAAVSGNITGFPVLVRLTQNNFVFSQAEANGGDIRFAKENGTPLAYEIERWDNANNEAEIWVNVDTIYGNDSTHYIIMRWGNPGAVSASNGTAVFDTGKGFQGVWHLDQPTGAIALDATINQFGGTPSATTPVRAAGIIGMGYQFDGASTCFSMQGTASSTLNFPQNGTYSLSAWVYADTLDYTNPQDTSYLHDMTIVSKDNCQYALKTRSTNWEFFEYASTVGWQGSFAPATQRAWKYVTGVRNGTHQSLYVDGQLIMDTVGQVTPCKDPRSTVENVTIGMMPGKLQPSASVNGPPAYFSGIIDEVRISSVSLTPIG